MWHNSWAGGYRVELCFCDWDILQTLEKMCVCVRQGTSSTSVIVITTIIRMHFIYRDLKRNKFETCSLKDVFSLLGSVDPIYLTKCALPQNWTKWPEKNFFKTNPPDSELGRELIKKRNFPVLNYAFFSL